MHNVRHRRSVDESRRISTNC